MVVSAATLDKLPQEVLRHIVGIAIQEHPPNFSALAQVSKACHAAALTWGLRCIQFRLSTKERLREDVNNLLDVCRRSGGLAHVRWLQVRGHLSLTKLKNDEEEGIEEGSDGPDEADNGSQLTKGNGKRQQASSDSLWCLQNHIHLKGVDDFLGQPENDVFGGDGSLHVSPEEDAAWLPVVHLIEALDHLTDFVFNTKRQFPPSLLQALQNHQTQCRLHLPHFRFRSLREETTDAHEMAVATSPLLHTLGVLHVNRDSAGNDDYNKEAVMRLVGGFSPNLKRLCLTHGWPVSSPMLHRSRGRPRVAWRGFKPEPVEVREGRASLEWLKLTGIGPIRPSTLETWQSITAFETLTYLNLSAGVVGDGLAWAAKHAHFPNLSSLGIAIDRDDEDDSDVEDGEEQPPALSQSAIAFFDSLQPLTSLSLASSIDLDVFLAILPRHGPALTSIALRPHESMYSITRQHRPTVFSQKHILALREACPLLENITMPIQRSMGSSTEVETYRIFSGMPKLSNLNLTLNCASPGVLCDGDWPGTRHFDDEWMDEPNGYHFGSSGTDEQRRIRNGNLYEAFTNCALDEKLAESIWNTIALTKQGFPLQSLDLHSRGGQEFGTSGYRSDISDVVEALSRSYNLRRPVREDETDAAPRVLELSFARRKQREDRLRKVEKSIEAKWGRQDLKPGTALSVFRRIWPAKEGSRHWSDDWESFPLQI